MMPTQVLCEQDCYHTKKGLKVIGDTHQRKWKKCMIAPNLATNSCQLLPIASQL
jgi:hypothetical protein